MAKTNDRVQHAWRAAAPPAIVTAVVCGLSVVVRWRQSVENPRASVGAAAGLTLVVFLTYFLLVAIGFKASSPGTVQAPRIYMWPTVLVIVLVVFGLLFYVLPPH
jgi:hypothetical protein